jgi:hypothetical protein
VPTSVDRGCHVVSVTDPYGRIIGFLDRTCSVSPIDNTHYVPITTTPSTRTEYFTRTLGQSTSLGHLHKVLHQNSHKLLQYKTHTKYFTRTLAKSITPDHLHKALPSFLTCKAKFFNVTIGKAAWEACSATWNLGTNSAFALGARKTTENQMIKLERMRSVEHSSGMRETSAEAHTRDRAR